MHKTNLIFKKMLPPHFCLKVACGGIFLVYGVFSSSETIFPSMSRVVVGKCL